MLHFSFSSFCLHLPVFVYYYYLLYITDITDRQTDGWLDDMATLWQH